jgi:hypothetical protein
VRVEKILIFWENRALDRNKRTDGIRYSQEDLQDSTGQCRDRKRKKARGQTGL